MAIAMTSPAPFFRTFSNKENGTFAASALRSSAPSTSSSSSTRKPRIGGFGRAPNHSTESHSHKPYDRRSSVARAKARATSPTKSVNASQGKIRRRAAPPPPISIPSASTSATSHSQSLLQSAIQLKNIPLRLPRPQIPPILSIPGDMEHVVSSQFVDWAVPRAQALFHDLLVVSSHYRPVPQFTRRAERSERQTLAFAIPGISTSTSAHVEAKIRGRLPDLCLAVTGKGEEKKPARLVPTSSVVYASQCSYWPRDITMRPSPTSAAGEDDDETLKTIKEEEEEEGSDQSDDSDATTRPHSPASSMTEIDTHSGSDSTSTPDSHPTLVHLPLLSLSIPHTASFPILHTHLHLSTYPLIQALLSLPLNSHPKQAIPEIRKMSTQDLIVKLEFLHGFWANLCALGIAGDRSWQGLGQAWGVVTGVIAERSKRPEGNDSKKE